MVALIVVVCLVGYFVLLVLLAGYFERKGIVKDESTIIGIGGVPVFPLLVCLFFWYMSNEDNLKARKNQKKYPELPAIAALVSGKLRPIVLEEPCPSKQALARDGRWLVLNLPDFSVAKESYLLPPQAIPRTSENVTYVVVVAPGKRVIAGFWRKGMSPAYERFVTEYTIYLIDLPGERLVERTTWQSPFGDSLFSWEENQNKPWPTIMGFISEKMTTGTTKDSNSRELLQPVADHRG